jgi:hypothetical protein
MPDLKVTCSRCESELHHECHPETLAEAAVDLFMWRPESGFPELKGARGKSGDEHSESVPFITESFLYPLLGKEDARSFMSRVDSLFRAMGIDPHGLREKARLRAQRAHYVQAGGCVLVLVRRPLRQHLPPMRLAMGEHSRGRRGPCEVSRTGPETESAVKQELAKLVRWLADVENVVTGRSVLTYRHARTNVNYVCAVCVDKQIVGKLFEHNGVLHVVGVDPACNCVTGAPLADCTVSRADQRTV